jgi:hypothetical protein
MLTTLHWRGLVLLPSDLLRGLPEPQQASIIAHELAHFLRRDHWVRWVEFVVVGVYWWHPVAWLARRQLQQAEESCCDAWVLSVFPDQSRGYAQALMAAVDFLSEVRTPAPAGACGFGQFHSLRRRLEMILKRTWRPELSVVGRMTLITVALGVLTWTPRAFSQSAPPSRRAPIAAAEPKTNPPEPAPAVVAAPPQQSPAPGTPKSNGPLPIAAAPDSSPPYTVQAARASTEERLDRLEAMLNRLLAELGNQPGAGASFGPKPVTPPPARGFAGGGVGARTTGPLPRAETLPPEDARTDTIPQPKPLTSPSRRTWAGPTQARTPGSAAAIEEIKARLVEMDFEIKSLELQLQRAQAQRELLQKQLKSSPDGSSRVAPPSASPQAPDTVQQPVPALPSGLIPPPVAPVSDDSAISPVAGEPPKTSSSNVPAPPK